LETTLIDGKNGRSTIVKACQFTMERIPNPLFPGRGNWLVLKGTKIGMNESHLRSFENETLEILRIRIEEID
jgi:hypothetical protein